jgi:hypothetical protein
MQRKTVSAKAFPFFLQSKLSVQSPSLTVYKSSSSFQNVKRKIISRSKNIFSKISVAAITKLSKTLIEPTQSVPTQTTIFLVIFSPTFLTNRVILYLNLSLFYPLLFHYLINQFNSFIRESSARKCLRL